MYFLTRYLITIWKFYFEIYVGYVLTNVQITFLTKKSKNIYQISRKIFRVRFDQKFGYVLVNCVRFDQKHGYVLTKIGYVLVGYVLALVRFDHNPNKSSIADVHGPIETRRDTSFPGGVRIRHECPMLAYTLKKVKQPQHTRMSMDGGFGKKVTFGINKRLIYRTY